MELVGEQKRIQALFSELRAEDVSLMRPFASVWNRAEAKAVAPRTRFNLSLVYATAFFVLMAISSVAVRRGYWRETQPGNQVNNYVTTPSADSKQTPTEPTLIQAGKEPPRIVRKELHQSSPKRRQTALSAANSASKKVASQAAAISNWQSPTTALLRSPSEQVFTSLPQLDENASELKSFLGKTPK